MIAFQPVAFSGDLFPVGVILGYAPDADTILQFEALNAKYDFQGSKEIRRDSVGAFLKKFLLGSSYFKGGLEHRSIRYEYASNNDNVKFNADVTVLIVAIGNQARWKSFTLGCDWFGYAVPIAKNFTKESISPTSADNNNRLESGKDTYAAKPTLELLHVYLGWMF